MRLLVALYLLASNLQADWRLALPGWNYQFPRDHENHPEFKTEWWYFTGNLSSEDGRHFGYQLTFFRAGVLPLDSDVIPLSRFVTSSVKFAHFAVSDLSTGVFHFFEKLSRGAYGEAGFGRRPRLAWIEDWSCELTDGDTFIIKANADDLSLKLALKPTKPVVIHGHDGISRKAEGVGRASHYYSFTRLSSEGVLRIGVAEIPVTGLSWFDREWSSNQLAGDQAGWDWFSLQFDDGSELMLYQIRNKDGGRDRNSSGTFVDAQGVATSLEESEFTLEPLDTWVSPESHGRYPIAWRIIVPRLNMRLDVSAALKNQELLLKPITYWEGAIRAQGTVGEKNITGSGYLELTGYASALSELQSK
jgi:predicted secreted hydrolase